MFYSSYYILSYYHYTNPIFYILSSCLTLKPLPSSFLILFLFFLYLFFLKITPLPPYSLIFSLIILLHLHKILPHYSPAQSSFILFHAFFPFSRTSFFSYFNYSPPKMYSCFPSPSNYSLHFSYFLFLSFSSHLPSFFFY